MVFGIVSPSKSRVTVPSMVAMTTCDTFVALSSAANNDDRDYGAEGDIDKVVAEKNRRQEALGLIEHVCDPPRTGHAFAKEVSEPRPLKG